MMRGIGISFAVLLFLLPDGAYGQGGACGLNVAQIQQPPVTPDIDARLQQMTTRLDAIEAGAKRQANRPAWISVRPETNGSPPGVTP